MKRHILTSDVSLTKKEIACYGVFGGGGFLYSHMMFASLILYYFTDIQARPGTHPGGGTVGQGV